MSTRSLLKSCVLLLPFCLLACGGSETFDHPAKETVIYSFESTADGTVPTSLLKSMDGEYYGLTYAGGPFDGGTVFKMTPEGVKTTIYSFGKSPADGRLPQPPLVQDASGTLYGTTSYGGAFGIGTVFILKDGVFTILYSFGTAGGEDGSIPAAGLLSGKDGYLYGTTGYGGTHGAGTVFSVSPTGAFRVLYSFGGPDDGSRPNTSLSQGEDGSLYGTTTMGGTNGLGTVFKFDKTGQESILYSFADVSPPDAISLKQPLIDAHDGTFYGLTKHGGAGGFGSIFRISDTGAVQTVYSFGGYVGDGRFPASLFISDDGKLYGLTDGGGDRGSGTLFELDANAVESVLYSFSTPDDRVALVQEEAGDFLGTSLGGGTNGYGYIFRVQR